MLDSLKQAGRNVGREISRTWENMSEGWRDLLSRSRLQRGNVASSPP